MRYYCSAQSVIRQAADTFVAGRFGDSEVWRGAVPILLRNKRCSHAQQTMLLCATKGWVVAQGGWRGVVSSEERSAHLLLEKGAPFR